MFSGPRKHLQKMKSAFVGFWQRPVQAGPLSQDPLRKEALMSVGRPPTEAARVLGHPCDLQPQREIIVNPHCRVPLGPCAEVGSHPLLPPYFTLIQHTWKVSSSQRASALECGVRLSHNTSLPGHASHTRCYYCLFWGGQDGSPSAGPRRSSWEGLPSMATPGPDGFCLTLLPHSLYLHKPLDYTPKASPQGLFPYLATYS